MIALSEQQRQALVTALVEGFVPEALERRVMDPLKVPYEMRSAARSYHTRVHELVQWAASVGRLGDLLKAAYEANPNSDALRHLNESTGLVEQTADLVEAIRPALTSLDARSWQFRLREIDKQVCLIRNRDDVGIGTAFLVGPDQLMTHTAVFTSDQEVPFLEALTRERFTACFEPGALEKRYAVLASEPYVLDNQIAIVRLDGPAGREYAAESTTGTAARARGWISPLPSEPSDGAVVIVYFAGGRRLVVSVDAHGLIRDDGEGLYYRTSTLPGAMGAPCFDARWRLLGVHVGTDLKSLNHGLSVTEIGDQLAARGLAWNASGGVYATAAAARSTYTSVKTKAIALDDIVRGYHPRDDAGDSADDVWSDENVEPSDRDLWSWAEAAAVSASFDPTTLVPAGSPEREALVAVLLESSPVRSPHGDTRWMLSERVRVRALERLAARGQLKAAREHNAGRPDDLLDAALGALIAGTPPTRADFQDPDRLRAMIQALSWLAGTRAPLPPREELLASLERATLVAPFRHLTQGYFSGRDAELSLLAAYVDGPDLVHGTPLPPVMLHAPGGMGKSALLAHFVLAHSERDTTRVDAWRPFAYLDFDRPELDARDPVGLLAAIARQLASQVPTLGERATRFVARCTAQKRAARPQLTNVVTKSRKGSLSTRAVQADFQDLLADLAELLVASHAAMPAPFVLVLDTLEEVQYATPDAIGPLAKLVIDLRSRVPALRPVLAGRVATDASLELTPIALAPLPPQAAEALLANNLPPRLAAKPDLMVRMVQVVGGNPLSLRLAAEVLTRESNDALDRLGEEELWRRVGDAIVQGQLYERIAGHLHEGRIKKLAIPGLVLRYLTWEIIQQVLAGPCGIEIANADEARALFDELAREVALVRRGNDATRLVLISELRRTVLEGFRKDGRSAQTRRQIHEAAIEYFSKRAGPENRAEEIYHRLWLAQDPKDVDARWTMGVDVYLRSAVEELDGPARAYLANRVGSVSDEAFIEKASLEEWEAYAETRTSDLLRLGDPAAALTLLTRRPERLPTSRLFLIESIARRSLPNGDLMAAEGAAAQAVRAAHASADPGEIQSALQELAQVRRLRHDYAGVLDALSALGGLGEQLGDDLILLHSEVASLESAVGEGELNMHFSENAVRVFSRLPDEIIARAPELARRVAAQVGAVDPNVLQRVVRIVGVGSLDEHTAGGLEHVLTEWAKRESQIEPFVPHAPASATDLASATQYLFSTRSLDLQTAREFTSWFRSSIGDPVEL
ncbi:AAA family ATPase [Cupriavidus sp. L7L]|uniref:AAA family ATPase n=1 Tax=Cupriavidus sp. L7L TaxID=2546443 RepID=UPI001055ED65|nr:AAA family ATPase [Cupriavidus sp. L7L]TDF56779.1 serine protease [Cupriavidus sp. L7L]